ncbi:3-deoxy-D-manno-octulosonic acid transferase [Psychrobacter sp. FDAARGOS_221]|uniref:3-deoxy-D-manno-octulosonic acid transferase n=1 Tax=Psychrobacter sp. FDAARGOS_221 TaxID=1975705 RepID=UPI000BB55D9A|nr:3-deoxy-D-manno-octulosonic acid transferase [Psychrobacter sp. FDAARGOS_221]PNK61630.1 3-deoxy-D-manno-octulosonic acid transferase [Psychrobacter sp. FDAARGOS_221]
MADFNNKKSSQSADTSNSLDASKTYPVPWYYQLAIKLLKPVYQFILWRRHQKAKKTGLPIADYNIETDARFGKQYPPAPTLAASHPQSATDTVFSGRTIWCHAVSLGETNTIAPMLKQMLAQGAKIWLTNTTQTGYARTQTLFAEALASGQMVHSFVPVDDATVIKRFVAHAKPDLVMFVETELWANILAVLHESDIPSVLVNARLSQKSFDSYAKFSKVSQGMMHNISMIIAQDVDSAKRFRKLGTPVPKIRRADSLKWSTSPIDLSSESVGHLQAEQLQQLQAKFAAPETNGGPDLSDVAGTLQSRPIWVAGSTHEGEETQVLQAHKQLLQQPGLEKALLILVPRHPERFDAVAEMIEQSGLTFNRRSQQQLIAADTQVYLADTMGELIDCYQLADVAFIGGSLVNIGGHNPIEAACFAKPVIMGTHTQSCHEVVAELSAAGALQVVASDDAANAKNSGKASKQEHGQSIQPEVSLYQALRLWLGEPHLAEQAGEKGQQLVAQKSDAMQRQLAMIEKLLADHYSKQPVDNEQLNDIDFDHFEVRQRSD